MDLLILLVLADVYWSRDGSGMYQNYTSWKTCTREELQSAEKAADKLELWLNNLSL